MENRKRISISGVQEELSLLLEKNQLRLTVAGKQGQYLLKPIPRDVKRPDQVSANEHLTMQVAHQVYKIQLAGNALILFQNGEPAYITKRFDHKLDGTKHSQEDFASLAGRTSYTAGRGFKYEGSYEDVALIIKETVPVYQVELEKLFTLVLFNYLFPNGDTLLKNFSFIDTSYGDYVLSPAYDLICTRLHVEDTNFALKDGLFYDEHETESFKASSFCAYNDFYAFALRIGIKETRAVRILHAFQQDYPAAHDLNDRSFLRDEVKEEYRKYYMQRLEVLNYSMTGKLPQERKL
ncbi:serine/threonine-protein kinase HipA [Pontibacter ummariensis]|uniref:Serine/threonine-protein kinase HipA n=1 Tax=Pontibacter ummariensis TaxID=1610492 RepID=A0A239IY68_9BACT|nr:HipA domain-containing protein [Pontibacter ummariensis]PRY09005.1 serine/threonine-protein kinase HipA [Pontibacter ummariensis]SNS98158.1 serine/threonine-protein kinase HipA [Pontibacter ummariensis]